MKFKSLYIATLALGAVALGACDDNWEQPPMDVPVFPEGLKANITVAELKEMTWQSGYNNVQQIGLSADGDSLILMGTVVSSDKSGNIYKKVVIQDETGGIALSINQSKLYQEFPQGAGIAINITGLYTGQYSSTYQIGIDGGTRPDRMELDVITPRVWFDPLEGRMDTLTVDGATLGTPGDKESAIKYAGRLVRIDNVTFTTPGEQFAPGETTSRRFKAADGTEYDLRSSSYSDFAYERIPEGTGSIVGILGYYGRNWQLELNSLDGLIGFDAAGTPDNPDTPDTGTLVLLKSDDANGMNGWVTDNVRLADGVTYVWGWRDYNSKYYLNGGTGNKPGDTEAYIISPVIDLTKVTKATARFEHAAKYQTTIRELCGMVVREQGATAWTALAIPAWPEAGNWTFVSSGDIDLSAYAGKKIQLAYKYGASAAGADTWEIRDLTLTGEGGAITAEVTDTPDQPDQPVTPGKPEDKGGTEGAFNFNDITTLTPAYSPSQEVADGDNGNFKIDVNDVLFTDASAGFVNSNPSGTAARLYHQPANDQYPDKWSLRWYNKSTTTFMVAEGYHITKIVFDTSTATYATALAGFTWPSGTFADNTWTPADATTSSVALPITKTVGFNKITIYYAK